MLDIGWSEMLIVGVVALIVVGPKDLPKMFHAIGEITGKARGMAREFQRAMDVAAKEAGVDGIAKDLRKVTSGRALKEAVGFDDIEKEFRDIGRDLSDDRKSPKAKAMPKAGDAKAGGAKTGGAKALEPEESEFEGDELDALDHDADLAERNANLSAVEELRLIRAQKIANARQKAADARARKEAEAEPEAWRPAAAAAPAAGPTLAKTTAPTPSSSAVQSDEDPQG